MGYRLVITPEDCYRFGLAQLTLDRGYTLPSLAFYAGRPSHVQDVSSSFASLTFKVFFTKNGEIIGGISFSPPVFDFEHNTPLFLELRGLLAADLHRDLVCRDAFHLFEQWGTLLNLMGIKGAFPSWFVAGLTKWGMTFVSSGKPKRRRYRMEGCLYLPRAVC